MLPGSSLLKPRDSDLAGSTFAEILDGVSRRLVMNGLRGEDAGLLVVMSGFFPGVFAAAYTREGRYIWVCPAFRATTGIAPESVMGRLVDEMFPAEWCQERLDVIARAIDRRELVPTVEVFRGRRMEGAVLPVMDAGPAPAAVYIGRFGLSTPQEAGGGAEPSGPPPQLMMEADWGPLSTLSRRELEVLRYIARGLDNAEIAAVIHRTKRAVEWHISNLYVALNCARRTDLFRFGVFAGLTEIDDEHWIAMVARVRDGREHERSDATGSGTDEIRLGG